MPPEELEALLPSVRCSPPLAGLVVRLQPQQPVGQELAATSRPVAVLLEQRPLLAVAELVRS